MRDNSAPAGGDTFGSILDRHRGEGPGFGILRLALAVLVLWFHARYLSRAPEPVAAVHSGIVAAIPQGFRPAQLVFLFLLPAFFALSGFLVTGSAFRLRATIPFLPFR